MAYSYDQIFAADPSNPSNVAQNAAITIFAPGDTSMTPLTITDPDGQPLANPIPVNANGFGSAFAHATLDRVAWAGGGFTGFFTSYEGMKNEAIDARAAAEAAAGTAGAEAAAVATAAIGTATDEATAAAASAATAASNASASATAAANSAALVGAPADTAIAAAINGSATATKTALNATYAHPVMVKSAFIDPTGVNECAPAVQAIIDSAPAGSTVYFPGGTYRISTALSIPSYLTLRGEGYRSRIDWRGAGTWVTLASKTQVKFRDLRIHLYNASAVGVDLSNSFRCSLTGVIIEGEHLATTGTTYHAQKGIVFRDNAGDNRLIDCDLNNLGNGIETASAQNYVIGGTFGTCWRSISGGDPAGVLYIAGISVTNTTFVGGIGATDTHFYVGGSAAEWLINQVWAEKCDKMAVVGTAAGGPRTFALRDSYVAGVSTTINIRNARQPILDNITFSNEVGDTPTDLVIHADVTYGYANTLRSLTGAFDFPANTFPAGWTVVGGRTSPSVVPRQAASENWTLTLPVTAVAAAAANWSGPAFNAARWMGVERPSSGAQNAEISWNVNLSAGTWALHLAHWKEPNRGIYSVYLDGVLVGTIDAYSASSVNGLDTLTGISVAASGKHTVRMVMATKNAASSAYYGTPSYLQFTRTA